MIVIPPVVPILMYHQCPEDFEAQLDYLRDKDYQFVHLFDVSEYLIKPLEKPLPERKIILTFDDGYQDFERVADLLKKMDSTGAATICVATNHISYPKENRKTWNGSLTLTWEELRKLRDEGYEIICHSASHANLDDVKHDSAKLRYELAESKHMLNYHLGIRMEEMLFFCLPYGGGWKDEANTDQRVNDALRQENFMGALRADYKTGQYWDRYCIPRCGPSNLAHLRSLLEIEFASN